MLVQTPTHTQRLLTIASILLCSHAVEVVGSTIDNDEENFKEALTFYKLGSIKQYIKQNKKYINIAHQNITPLLVAIEQQDKAYIDYLVDNRADTTYKDVLGNTPLHCAIEKGLPIDTIKRLLGPNKANLNARNNTGLTPLLCTDEYQHGTIPLMKWLIQQGADITLKYKNQPNDVDEKTLLQLATEVAQKSQNDNNIDQHIAMTKVVQLLKESSENATKNQNDVQTFKQTLEKVMKQGISKKPPQTTTEKDLDLIQSYIAQNKVHIDTTDDTYNSTALVAAIMHKKENFAKQLLQQGANPNHRTRVGSTPLHVASIYECRDTAMLLVKDHKVPIDAINTQGNTPLMYAYKKKNINMMQLLLQYNADLNIQYGEEQQTLLEIANKENETDVVNLLQTTKNNRNKALGTGGGQNRNNNINNNGQNNKQQTNTNNHLDLNNNNKQNNNINNNTDQKPKDDKRLQKFAGITAVVITVLALLKWITTPPPTPDKRTRTTSKSNKHKQNKHNPTTSTPNQA